MGLGIDGRETEDPLNSGAFKCEPVRLVGLSGIQLDRGHGAEGISWAGEQHTAQEPGCVTAYRGCCKMEGWVREEQGRKQMRSNRRAKHI